jgi:hypothetical protein
MRRSEAPAAGWYPDPEGGVRLRWWDGTDWTDRYRPRPSLGELTLARLAEEQEARADTVVGARAGSERSSPRASAAGLDPDRLIAEVQRVARAEVDRAADVFTERAHRVAREIQPLVTQYRSELLRWLRWAAVVVVLLAAVWLVVQLALEASLLDWLGDRVDNLSS